MKLNILGYIQFLQERFLYQNIPELPNIGIRYLINLNNNLNKNANK